MSAEETPSEPGADRITLWDLDVDKIAAEVKLNRDLPVREVMGKMPFAPPVPGETRAEVLERLTESLAAIITGIDSLARTAK